MGFQPNITAGGDFLSEAEKIMLANSGEPFEVTLVTEAVGKDFGSGPKPIYQLSVIFADGSNRTVTFAKGSGVATRDQFIEQLKEYIDTSKETVVCSLSRSGRSYVLDVVSEE
jgi:hypothetical protein